MPANPIRGSSHKPKKVVGYIRVSSVIQASDGESLERQEEQIRDYCARKGIAPSDLEIICDSGVSGFKSNRPGYVRLNELCTSRQIKTVIVYDLDRLSRSTRGTLAFVEDVIQRHGIEFVCLQKDIDTSTPMGKMFLTFSAMINQAYRDEIAFKTKAALAHKRSKGEKTGGSVPFGFFVTKGKRLSPLAAEVKTIQQIVRLRRQGLSLRAIVQALRDQGIKSKTGKEKWHPKVVRGVLAKHRDQILSPGRQHEPRRR